MSNQQLGDYISQSLAAGKSREEIIKALSGVGWPQTEIEAAMPVTGQKETPADNPFVTEPEVKKENSPNPAIFGDGMMVNVYDLGINSHRGPEGQTGKSEVVEAEIKKDYVIKQVESLDQPVENKPGSSVPKKQSGKLFIAIGIILLVFIISGVVWWLVIGKSADTTSANSQPNKQNSPVKTGSTNSSTANPPTETSLSDKQYSSPKGFSLYPPANWIIDDSGNFETLVTFSNPIVDEEMGNKFAANINVVSEGSQNAGLDEYLALSRDALAKTFSGYTIIGEKMLKVADRDVAILEAKYEMGVYTLHNMQLVVKNNDTYFVVTGTSTEKNWDKYKTVIESSLMSFR